MENNAMWFSVQKYIEMVCIILDIYILLVTH